VLRAAIRSLRKKRKELKKEEQQRLKALDDEMLKRIFGFQGDKVTWDWRVLRNKNLQFCTSYLVLLECFVCHVIGDTCTLESRLLDSEIFFDRNRVFSLDN
jgi:hypothetical protein